MKLKNLPGAWVLECFHRGGVDLDILNQKLPEDVHLMLYEMETILPDNIERLLQACAEISNHQDFGLLMNELVDISMYGLLGYILLNSGTVHDLFDALVRYHRVHHNGDIYYKLNLQKTTVNIQFCYHEHSDYAHRQTTDWGLGFIPSYLQSELRQCVQPLKAQFTHSPPKNLSQLHYYFGHHLEFNQQQNQLVYPRSILKKSLSKADPMLLKILQIEADKHLLSLKKESAFIKEIKGIIFQHLTDNHNNASDIANSLNLSLSSFKRKLIKEHSHFKNIKDSVKNDLAKQLLSKSNISISDIAQQTGFKNSSGLTRFFIRYNQQKPLAYRKTNQLERKR
jgi:AraC-like DNA-binding protein